MSIATPLESTEPLQHLILVSLTMVNEIHTWLVYIYIYIYIYRERERERESYSKKKQTTH